MIFNSQVLDKELSYWSDVCVSVSQVLFGIAAATFFVGEFDSAKVIVIASSLVLAFMVWILGWRILL